MKILIPYIPKRKAKGYGVGDMIKKALNSLGIDCEKQKWLPPGCEERRKRLNRFKIRI